MQPEGMNINPGAEVDIPTSPVPTKWLVTTIQGQRTNSETGFTEPVVMVLVRISHAAGATAILLTGQEAEAQAQMLHREASKAKHGIIVPNGFSPSPDGFTPLGGGEE